MTTTNVYQGLGDGSRASSKVLKPPGGGSSNIFGDPEPPRGRPQQQQQHQTNVLGQPLGQGGGYSSGQQPGAPDVAYGGPDYDQNNAASQASPAGMPSTGPPPEMGRFSGKKQGQDSFNNIFGGESQQQGGQRGRRKGDVSSADRRMEVNMMAFNDHGVRHDDNMWAHEADLQEQRKATLALNRHHAKAPVTDTYSNLFGDHGSSPDGANKRRLANTVSEYNIITGILNTPQMKDHTSPQSANFTSASRSQRNRGAYNPITGEDYEQSPQAHRNASRVTNPPGGKSTGLW